jgi:NAD(P)-dependent dehydrogenase (short-subunit alcohol dehydrogenase family)
MRAALITGGTAGIGAACVERLRADGYAVAFTGRNVDRGTALAARTGARFIEADATDRTATDAAVEAALVILGRVDLLVLNAGVLVRGQVTETSDVDFATLLETNLTSPFRTARAAFGQMRRQGGGAIVVIASDTAIRGSHRIAAYSVMKAGVAAVAELLGAEGAPYGIRANALCPGNTLPGMAGDDPATWRATPSGRFVSAAAVAGAVAWLGSDEAAHVNGATIRIDGGAGAALQILTRA